LKKDLNSFELAVGELERIQRSKQQLDSLLDKKKKKREDVNEITQELKAIKEQYVKLEQRQMEIRDQLVYSMEFKNRSHARSCGHDRHWSHGGDQHRSHGDTQHMIYDDHRHGEHQYKGQKVVPRGWKRKGITCRYCKKMGHIERECWIKHPEKKRRFEDTTHIDRPHNNRYAHENVNVVEENKPKDSNYTSLKADIEVEGYKCQSLIDTGASIRIIRQDIVHKIGNHKQLQYGANIDESIIAANGNPLKQVGLVSLQIAIGNHKSKHWFRIIEDIQPAIIIVNDILSRLKVQLHLDKNVIIQNDEILANLISKDPSYINHLIAIKKQIVRP
jgi:hypothetical protein